MQRKLLRGPMHGQSVDSDCHRIQVPYSHREGDFLVDGEYSHVRGEYVTVWCCPAFMVWRGPDEPEPEVGEYHYRKLYAWEALREARYSDEAALVNFLLEAREDIDRRAGDNWTIIWYEVQTEDLPEYDARSALLHALLQKNVEDGPILEGQGLSITLGPWPVPSAAVRSLIRGPDEGRGMTLAELLGEIDEALDATP